MFLLFLSSIACASIGIHTYVYQNIYLCICIPLNARPVVEFRRLRRTTSSVFFQIFNPMSVRHSTRRYSNSTIQIFPFLCVCILCTRPRWYTLPRNNINSVLGHFYICEWMDGLSSFLLAFHSRSFSFFSFHPLAFR